MTFPPLPQHCLNAQMTLNTRHPPGQQQYDDLPLFFPPRDLYWSFLLALEQQPIARQWAIAAAPTTANRRQAYLIDSRFNTIESRRQNRRFHVHRTSPCQRN